MVKIIRQVNPTSLSNFDCVIQFIARRLTDTPQFKTLFGNVTAFGLVSNFYGENITRCITIGIETSNGQFQLTKAIGSNKIAILKEFDCKFNMPLCTVTNPTRIAFDMLIDEVFTQF
jgi:hypothetical protein